MTWKHKLAFAACALALSATVNAQAPLLTVSTPQRGQHGWEVTITNTYKSPATAFWLDINGPGAHAGKPLARYWVDAVPGPKDYKLALLPGQSRTIPFGNGRWQGISYRNVAVIYGDGNAAGDSAVVTRIERIRAAEAADLVQDMAMLAQARDDGTDPAVLAATFDARANAHMAALQDGIAHVDDRVCKSAATNLRRTDQNRMTKFVGLQAMFTSWLSQLRAAAPVASQP